jgi:hypothetical protein
MVRGTIEGALNAMLDETRMHDIVSEALHEYAVDGGS